MLSAEIETARRQVKTDSYAMSVGEIATMYENSEIKINPAFQRLFRWDDHQKSKLVESILLGIPIPPIFVFETGDAQWELIDGLQRISTILEFMGKLKDPGNRPLPPVPLHPTTYLPSLKNVVWEKTSNIRNVPLSDQVELDKSFQFEFRRSKINIQILKRTSDELSKYDLFQRLNAGGTIAEPQEVRNCAVIMSSPEFFKYIEDCADIPSFKSVSRITDSGKKVQKHLEYVMRFFVFAHTNFDAAYDVEEFIDKTIISISKDKEKYESIGNQFREVFDILDACFGDNALRKFEGGKFTGQVGFVALESIAIGIARNLQELKENGLGKGHISKRIKDFWSKSETRRFAASGVSGRTRLQATLPFGEAFFKP